jgi:hypothetical protein
VAVGPLGGRGRDAGNSGGAGRTVRTCEVRDVRNFVGRRLGELWLLGCGLVFAAGIGVILVRWG